MLKVYGFSRVNSLARGRTKDLRVLWALEEMQLPFELIGMDHPAHALNTDAYRELSPFEQLPAIDDDGIVLSESAAILIYLAKKSGQLMPRDPVGEAQVVRWCFGAVTTVEFPMLNLALMKATAPDAKGANAQRDMMVAWANRMLTDLDRWLEDREFVATDTFTVADILMPLVLTQVKDDSLFEPYVHVQNYRERCLSRAAWRRTFESYCARVEAA